MKSENYIPGIYNYCDRWCEKCQLAHRYKLYADEQEQLKNANSQDDFIEIVAKSLSKTIELLYTIAEEKGIDLDTIETDEELEKERQTKFEEATQHPLFLSAEDYSNKASQWLKEKDYFEKEKAELIHLIEIGVDVEKHKKSIQIIDEALSIINWYQFQILVKLSTSIRFFPHAPEFEDEIQNMHHAAAKIALIGIENSMKAWQSLLEMLNEENEDFILNLLLQLERLKRNILTQFPLVNQFKRPGFDE